ncbi:hypothetical protein HPB47_013980 [Ixodes persulcatus]|uniref:Uncharacterized protein n=1 Tax=Ixodes persulcatus TaxID=34615 RepID=A0AC60QXG3_IXOPE|nr:hypothetical protein HPB47_013980 [Ixodes persulcatus]
MNSFQHLLIAITLIAAAINVKQFDKASGAVDVIVMDCMLETRKVNEEAEARDFKRAKSPFLEPGDMEALMDAGTDSIFVRDISRALWPDDLRNRSLTGTPCRRLLKSGALGKRALTPQKLKYIRRALAAYIERNPSPVVSAALRLGQLNTHMRRLLGDENRKRH